MARRITIRLIFFSTFFLILLYVVVHSSSYGLSRKAQIESLLAKSGAWPVNSNGAFQQDNTPEAHPELFEEEQKPQPPTPNDNELRPIHVASPQRPPEPSQTTSTTITTKAPQQQQPSQEPASVSQPVPTLPESEHESNATPEPEPKPEPPRQYSRALVVARTKKEIAGSAWIRDKVLVEDTNLIVYPYTVDLSAGEVPPDRTADDNPRVPANKGHEAMVYLTYLVDHYNSPNLSDVSLFMHAHRYTWHNNDLLDSDALNIVTRLSTPKVLRDGYFNLRCHLDPGCPAHLHPATKIPNPQRPEEMIIGDAWSELFPGERIPEVLSQPCCSQFALSKEMIRAVPLETYVRLRDWLIKTNLVDQIAGRVFEYVWQKLFLGQNEWCPVEHVCYCDGYGVCFGGQDHFLEWFDDRIVWRALLRDYQVLERREKISAGEIKEGDTPAPASAVLPVVDPTKFDNLTVQEVRDKMGEVRHTMTEVQRVMDDLRRQAFLNGNSPRNRAIESGRDWKEGDGF